MGTNAGFTPPAQPKCAYEPRMTHAEAVALRDAGGLDPNCVVVITDGPVIGTAGNTSPTEIELNPVNAGDIGRTARIHTTFDNVAFAGNYNIDDGANGSINEIIDHWNNRVSDEDPGAPTVHTQFPYHLSSTNLRDNDINDSTLIGWDTAAAAGVVINDNTLLETNCNLTGMTSGQIRRNNIQGPGLTISTAQMNVTSNDIKNSSVTLQGTTTSTSNSFSDNTVLKGRVTVTAATTGRIDMSRNVFGGTGPLGYRVLVDGATANVTVFGNRLFNGNGTGTDELWIKDNGAGTVTVSSNELTATFIDIAGAAGSVSIFGNSMSGTHVTKDAAATGALDINQNVIGEATVTVGAANGATTNLITDNRIQTGIITLNGPVAAPGRNDLRSMGANAIGVTVAATATAGININGGFFSQAVITQNRTAGTSSTALNECDMRGASAAVTDNGTTDPGQGPAVNRCQFRDASLTLGNFSGRTGNGTAVQQVDAIGSALTVSGMGATGIVDAGRLTKATFNNGGFTIQTFEMLGGSKTLTADQSNKLFSPAYDNYL